MHVQSAGQRRAQRRALTRRGHCGRESTQHRESSRHAATAADFEAHPPPFRRGRETERTALRSFSCAAQCLRALAESILTGWGIPALCAGDVSPPVLPAVSDGSFCLRRRSYTRHITHPSLVLPCEILRVISAHAACYSRRLLLFM